MMRKDEYGRGFIQYMKKYSRLSAGKETYTVSGISAAVRDGRQERSMQTHKEAYSAFTALHMMGLRGRYHQMNQGDLRNEKRVISY